jgi:hypothetical protein
MITREENDKYRQGKMNSFFKPNELASIKKPSAINGSKVCRGCIYPSSVYKHGHDLTCPSSEYFGMTQKQKQDAIQEKRRMKALKTMSFTIPKDDMTKGPSDPDYAILQGVTVHIIRWDLNFLEVFLPCCFCNDGELVPERWDFVKKKLTPVFDISVPTEWVTAMRSKCKCCKKLVAGNGGNLMHKLPSPVRVCYPVDCRYAQPGKLHLLRGTSRLVKKLLVTDGSGELASRLLFEQRGQQYEDVELT